MSQSARWILGLVAVVLVATGLVVFSINKPQPTPSASGTTTTAPIFYKLANAADGSITRVASDMGPVTRIKFTPDNKYMLVGVLTGQVFAFTRSGDDWVKPATPAFTIDTAFPGFPPDENGLTGIGLAADYATTGEVFVSYGFQAAADNFLNRVSRVTLAEEGGKLVGTGITQIFEGNVPTASSHQIQAIAGVMVAGTSHALFQMGEGFEAARSQDLTKDGGKLMLIQRDGANPLGPRPFADQPKVQAIGLRNPPDMVINDLDPQKRIGIVDTGPDQFDRFIYGKFIDLVAGAKVQGIDLGWNGTTDSLTASRFDPNTTGKPDPILFRWDPTHTATNLVFHPGKGAIPTSTNDKTSVLVNLFGRTGETGVGADGKPKPGREIWLGDLTLGNKPAVSWKPFIVRTAAGIDKEGHPIALERDPETNDLVFADILEGSIYWVTLNK